MPPIVWGVLILSAVILLPMVAVVAHAMEGKRPAPTWKQQRNVDRSGSAPIAPNVEHAQALDAWRAQNAPLPPPVAPLPHRHQPWRTTARKPWRAQAWARGN